MYSHSRVTAELLACDRELAKATAEEIRGQAEQVAQAVAGAVAVEVSRIIHGLRQRIDQMADSATGPAKTAIGSIQGRIREIGERESARQECRAKLNDLRAEFDGIASEIGSLAGA
jgi:vacuolar-type H+-ATPase subunit H